MACDIVCVILASIGALIAMVLSGVVVTGLGIVCLAALPSS
jgi:hypothetical protein